MIDLAVLPSSLATVDVQEKCNNYWNVKLVPADQHFAQLCLRRGSDVHEYSNVLYDIIRTQVDPFQHLISMLQNTRNSFRSLLVLPLLILLLYVKIMTARIEEEADLVELRPLRGLGNDTVDVTLVCSKSDGGHTRVTSARSF